MRKFLGTLVILIVIVAVVGFFRGWFNISTSNQPGNTNIELQIDKDKIKEDAEKVKEKAEGLASELEGGGSETTEAEADPEN